MPAASPSPPAPHHLQQQPSTTSAAAVAIGVNAAATTSAMSTNMINNSSSKNINDDNKTNLPIPHDEDDDEDINDNGDDIMDVCEDISFKSRERYKQKYLPAWELDSRLRDWIAPCPNDEFAAWCKVCNTNLHAHKKGLVVHSNSHKHKRHMTHPSASKVSLYSDSLGQPTAVEGEDLNRSASAEISESSFDHFNITGDEESLRKIRKQKLRQELNVFNEKWLFEPIFSSWIRKISYDHSKALCAACKCVLTAGRSELKKHIRSKKHKKAILEGPFEELDESQIMRLYPGSLGRSCSKSSSGSFDATHLRIPALPFEQRHISTMRPTSVSTVGLRLEEVLKRLENHVPLMLAEKWDKVGIMTRPTVETKVHHILLTIDFNERVVLEAIKKRAQLILSYHPPIFQPLESLKPTNWKERALLMCIENKITVYSPHTALDAIKGGINDWLISTFIINEGDSTRPITYSNDTKYTSRLEVLVTENQNEIRQAFSEMNNVTMTEYGNSTDICVACNSKTLPDYVERLAQHSLNQQIRVSQLVPSPLPGVGMGRIATLAAPLPLYEVVQRTKNHLDLTSIRLALSPKHTRDTRVSKIAVCAGSGGSILKQCSADMWITGEMSHHDVLDATEKGISVILCEHSNTERGFFKDWAIQLKSAIFEEKVDVFTSDVDRDPLKSI